MPRKRYREVHLGGMKVGSIAASKAVLVGRTDLKPSRRATNAFVWRVQVLVLAGEIGEHSKMMALFYGRKD